MFCAILIVSIREEAFRKSNYSFWRTMNSEIAIFMLISVLLISNIKFIISNMKMQFVQKGNIWYFVGNIFPHLILTPEEHKMEIIYLFCKSEMIEICGKLQFTEHLSRIQNLFLTSVVVESYRNIFRNIYGNPSLFMIHSENLLTYIKTEANIFKRDNWFGVPQVLVA